MNLNETNLLEEFNGVSKLLSKYQLWHYRRFGPSGDPHRGQGRVLAILKLQPEMSQKDLGYLLDMRNQSLGELLGKLEKTGAITREPSEEDRRSMNIKLTEYGAKLVGQIGGKPDDIGKIFDCLSAQEKENLHGILGHLSQELETLLGPDEASDNVTSKDKSESHHHKTENEELRKKHSADNLHVIEKPQTLESLSEPKEGAQ